MFPDPAIPTVLTRFGINPEGVNVKRITQGYINASFLISEVGTPKYVLQRINTAVFGQPEALMRNIETVLPLLDAPDYHPLELLRTAEGASWTRDAMDGFWRAFTYLSGSRTLEHTRQAAIASEAGRILSVFHRLVAGLPAESLEVPFPRFHHLGWRHSQLNDAVAAAATDRMQLAAPWTAIVDSLVTFCSDIPWDRMPLRVCHNDPKLSNILFDASGARALCLIDLDTLMPGYLIHDFGDAARAIITDFPEDHPDIESMELNLGQYAAFVRGFASGKLVLEEAERKWLPYGLVLMPLLHGIRALADYLQGDIYYRIEYPEQNLNRARCLLRLSQLAREQMGPLQATWAEALG